MDERFKVAIGYPAPGMPSGMSSLRRRGHLTADKFRAWGLLMSSLADMDKQDQECARERAQMSLPPSPMAPGLLDVMIMWHAGDASAWVRQTAALSAKSIDDMIEFLAHWSAVEDEQEAEMRGAR